jgi:hypothetical protein
MLRRALACKRRSPFVIQVLRCVTVQRVSILIDDASKVIYLLQGGLCCLPQRSKKCIPMCIPMENGETGYTHICGVRQSNDNLIDQDYRMCRGMLPQDSRSKRASIGKIFGPSGMSRPQWSFHAPWTMWSTMMMGREFDRAVKGRSG